MHRSIDLHHTANTFETCAQLRRSAREAADRARRMRAEAAEARLRAVRMRQNMERMKSGRPPDAVSGFRRFPATEIRCGATSRAAQLALLTAFVHARLDEEGNTADLFHETGCPDAGTSACHCPVPERVRHDVTIRHGLARDCEEALRDPDHDARDWPHNELAALLRLKVLALPYELHRQWREEWRP
ncbi:DUF6221 family protein [Streptomyces paromomycinus]|uniref:Uncharacterized protein n=1 Tax=Streptomyces paromomycinus TaxID=92743 RepID=A0A401VV87_STREY|nr:DUF6221 family protein [Streptomyces paromomycinus]GCD40984.1 hypothetical protein GKJPGBOP_00637 [Streptomyces paromomycinus]